MLEKKLKFSFQKSFTLLELLITIAILAVLASISFVALNPAEQIKKARDAQRLTELRSIEKAVNIFEIEYASASLGDSTLIYLSLPDTNSNCSSYSLPPIPSPFSAYRCVTEQNMRKNDGTGWIPLNFQSIGTGSPLAKLPIDPVNDQNYYYTYTVGGSFMVSALSETKDNSQAAGDGGRMPGVIEIGSNISLGPFTRDNGLVNYWPLDEGSGTSITDYSGKNHTGSMNGAIWQSGTGCKKGSCLSLDGLNDYTIKSSDSDFLDLGTESFTACAWIKASPSANYQDIVFSKGAGGVASKGYWFAVLTTGKLILYVTDGSSYIINGSQSVANVADGNWHHVAFSWNPRSGAKIYVDGTLDKTISITTSVDINSNTVFYSGGSGSDEWSLNGSLDEVRVYKRDLSLNEIISIYNGTK